MKITEKQYLNIVASLGCIVCGADAEIHHIRSFSGMGQRGSNWLTVPLCPHHHRTGPDAIHQRTKDEWKYLALTVQAVANKLAQERIPF